MELDKITIVRNLRRDNVQDGGWRADDVRT